MWGSNNGYDPITNIKEYSLFTDIHDDGEINESIGNGGIVYDNVIDEITCLSKTIHTHLHHAISNQLTMLT